MDDVTFPDLVRGFLISASLVVAVGCFLRLVHPLRRDTTEERFLVWGALFSIVALGGRSVVAIQDGDPLVWPLIFFVATLSCFAMYLTSPRGRRK